MNNNLKASILTFFLALISESSFAVNMTCRVITDFDLPHSRHEASPSQWDGQSHIGIFSDSSLECETPRGNTFYGQIKFYAPGVYFGFEERLMITCPLVSSKKIINRLKNGKSWGVGGPKVKLGALVGAGAGLAMNHRGATCFLSGLSLELGAAAGIAAIKIDKVKDSKGDVFKEIRKK